MKRTTITLTDELAVAVEREARRRRTSVSEVARDALAEHLGVGNGKPREIPFIGLGASGYRHTGRDMEEILAAEWTPDRDR